MIGLELVTASDVASGCAEKLKTLATLLVDNAGASHLNIKGVGMMLFDYQTELESLADLIDGARMEIARASQAQA